MVLAAPIFSDEKWVGLIDAVVDVDSGGLSSALPDAFSDQSVSVDWDTMIIDAHGTIVGEVAAGQDRDSSLSSDVATVVPFLALNKLRKNKGVRWIQHERRYIVKADLPFGFALIAVEK